MKLVVLTRAPLERAHNDGSGPALKIDWKPLAQKTKMLKRGMKLQSVKNWKCEWQTGG